MMGSGRSTAVALMLGEIADAYRTGEDRMFMLTGDIPDLGLHKGDYLQARPDEPAIILVRKLERNLTERLFDAAQLVSESTASLCTLPPSIQGRTHRSGLQVIEGGAR